VEDGGSIFLVIKLNPKEGAPDYVLSIWTDYHMAESEANRYGGFGDIFTVATAKVNTPSTNPINDGNGSDW
jgi:hypothetical protein